MSNAVFFFGGYHATQDDIDSWLRSARRQKPVVEFVGFPWPADTGADAAGAVKGFKKGGKFDSAVKGIEENKADTIYVVGHSSGCAIANAVDAALKKIDNIVLVALDGFGPSDKQLDRTATQVWGAECGHVKSRNFPRFDKGRRRVHHATDCKTMWALHFSLANAAAKDHLVHSIRTGYARCEANLSFLRPRIHAVHR
jgi:hypothetical protein